MVVKVVMVVEVVVAGHVDQINVKEVDGNKSESS